MDPNAPQLDPIYNSYDKNLYRITGDEEQDQIMNLLQSNASSTTDGTTAPISVAPDSIDYGTSATNTVQASGSATSQGKTTFDNSVPGYILGFDTSVGVAKFYIGNTTSYLNWDGTTLTIAGSLNVTSGTIGGWTINATTITSATGNVTLDSAGNITVGAGNNVVILSSTDATNRLWVGNATAASAPFRVDKTGALTASNVNITGGSIATTTLNPGVMGWTTDIVFTSASATQVNWTSGHIVSQAGVTYTISSGNTGTMSAINYIYLDTGSPTVLQVTTSYATATGDNKILVATAQNNTVGASVIPFGGSPPIIDASAQIVAASITATQIAASTITAAKLSVSQLSAITANMGTITAGTITLPSGGFINSGQTTFNTGIGFFLGNVSSVPKFSIGDGSSNYLAWDGNLLRLYGLFQFGTRYLLGSANDSMVSTNAGSGSITRYLLDTELQTGSSSSSTARLLSPQSGSSTGIGAGTDSNIKFQATCITGFFPFSGANVFAFAGITPVGTAAVTSSTAMTLRHIGFYFTDNSGSSATAWATCADGTTQTITSLGRVTSPNFNDVMRFEKTGTTVKYYMNDVLVATHTTNVPNDGSVYALQFIVGNNASGKNLILIVSNNYQLVTQQ